MTREEWNGTIRIVLANVGDARMRRSNVLQELKILDEDLTEIAAYVRRLLKSEEGKE